jgi:phosphoglycolate phosphatase-like HAD superfamily hydrolase
MTDLSDTAKDILRSLAHAVAQHRQSGGPLDNLPPQQRELLQAMDRPQRQFFMEELAKADAEAAISRFRASLSQWRVHHLGTGATPEEESLKF